MASSSLSAKQHELLDIFRGLIDKYQIKVLINPEAYTLKSPIAVDVEHDEAGNLVGIGAYDGEHAYYWTNNQCGSIFTSADLILHNGITDFECLRSWGIDVKDSQLVWDTMLLGHILDSSLKSYGLKAMAERELGIVYPSYDDIVGKKTAKQKTERVTLDKQPMELVALYNAMDCFVTYKLYEKQLPQQRVFINSKNNTMEYFRQIEKPSSSVFQKMMNRGIRIDLNYLAELKKTLECQQSPIKHDIWNELGDINLNSPKQLLEALHAKDIYPELKGKPSTDKRALERFKDTSIVGALLRFSEYDTLLSSFVYPYLERNQEYVHPYFNQVGTRTGRLSCSNPNLLQIPRRTDNGKLVRRMFIPRDGMVMGDCDFGQIEPRVLAHLSKDPVLCEMFNDGVDFHTFTAERLGISRDRAKILNLSVGYRATFKSVSSQLKCTDSEAQNEIDKWWSLFPALRRWQDTLIYEVRQSGYCTTLLGRRIKVDNLNGGTKWQREAAERQLINNITQGSAAEIMKKAMISIDNVDPHFGLLVQVYDELLFESPESAIETDLEFVKRKMELAVTLDVPLTVDAHIGTNWGNCK